MNKEQFIDETLQEYGEECSPSFYMKLAWKAAQGEVATEILEQVKAQQHNYDGLYVDERITDIIEKYI